jgi:hypothetical protein
MSTNLTVVLRELLQNTSNLKVLRELMTPDATYVSLNFNTARSCFVWPSAVTKEIESWSAS